MEKTITFKIVGKSDYVTAASFSEAVNNFVNILNGMEREIVAGEEKAQGWKIVALAMKSPPQISFAGNAVVADLVMDGLEEINARAHRPKHFTDSLLNRAKRLVGLLDDGISGYELSSGKRTVRPTQHVAANVDAVIGSGRQAYSEKSQIEGRLEALSVHGQLPEFSVYDPLTDQPIRCIFKPESLHEVAELIERRARVRVSGMMKFNAKHRPLSVEVETYEPLPEQAELPQFDDLHKAEINITGGMDSVDFVREQRDGDQD